MLKREIEKVVVDGQGCDTVLKFRIKSNENPDRLSTLYRLPKLKIHDI